MKYAALYGAHPSLQDSSGFLGDQGLFFFYSSPVCGQQFSGLVAL